MMNEANVKYARQISRGSLVKAVMTGCSKEGISSLHQVYCVIDSITVVTGTKTTMSPLYLAGTLF
jgi:hypothetical protein